MNQSLTPTDFPTYLPRGFPGLRHLSSLFLVLSFRPVSLRLVFTAIEDLIQTKKTKTKAKINHSTKLKITKIDMSLQYILV